MKQTSQEYQKKIKTSGRHFQAKLLIGDKTFRDFSDFKITSSVNAEDALTIGNCISSLLECKLLNVQDMSLFQGKQCKAYLGLALDTKEYEWILMGTYTIAEVNKEDMLYHIKAYDAFYLSEKGFFSELAGMQKISAILEEQCKKMGSAYAGGDDGTSVDVQQLEGKSIREVIGLLASYCGKNAVINPQGELCLIWYQDSNVVLDASRFRDPLDVHDGNTYISSMKCAIDKDIVYSTGSGLGIEFSNPLMSQQRLEQLFQSIKGFTYRAGKVELQMGQPELDAGDIVTIEDKRGERYRFAIMSITYEFDGGCYCQLEAKAKTETSAQFSFQGTLSSKIDNVHTDLTTTKQLVADTIDAFEGKFETIDTNNLQVNERLQANEGEIETLKSNTITSAVLDSKLAIIDQAMIGKADITQLNVLQGSVNVLDTKVGTIDTIVSHVTTSDSSHSLLINAQTAVVDHGYFRALAADAIQVNDLKAGEINTTKFHLTSEEGNLTLNDNTMQIKDAKRVRVQIGKDASGDYGLYQWDASGNLTWDSNGLTKDGIKQPIIVDEMISDTAAIDGKKLNISSVVSSINDGTSTIEASHILYDGKALDVAFGTMSTSVSTIDQTLKRQEPLWNQGAETAISALKQAEAAQMAADNKAKIFATQPVPPYRVGDLWVQGKSGMILRCITARIKGVYNANDWEKADAYSDDSKALEVEGKVSEVKEVMQVHSTQLSAQDGKIATLITDTSQVKKDISVIQGDVNTAQGSITQLQNKYSGLQQSVDGISSTVGEHSSSISTITKTADAAKASADVATSTAESAKKMADTAESAANSALSTANSAKTTAEAAKTSATAAQTTANSKAKIFIAQPLPPYQIGDLWVAGAGGEIKRCKTARTSGSYTATDWEKADHYTDDTKANAVDARVTTEIKKVSDKQSSIQQSVDSISTRVSASETTITTISDTVNSNKENWDQAATALTTANEAKTSAETAKSNAESAKTTAATAASNASSALTTANSAKTTADSAKTTADSAKTTATTASTNASNAVSTANNAKTTADNAQKLATSKSKIFNAQPVPPYQVGDLWVPGAGGEIKRCKTARTSGSYTATDWEKADKYTDDTKANAVDARVTTEIKKVSDKQSSLQQSVDIISTRVSASETTIITISDTVNSNKENWDQAATALTTANSAKTTADSAKTTADSAKTTAATASTNAANAVSTANSAKTTADNAQKLATSKSKIFNAQPLPPYQVGDLWVPGAGGEIKRCKTARTSGSYTATDWEKADKYSDDTKANAVDARVTTEIKTVTSKQTALEQNINGFKATVSSTYSTKVETQDQINNSIIQVSEGYNSSIEATKSAILQSVSADYTLQSDTDALSQHVDTVISQTAKDIEFRFNTAQELLNQLDGKVDGNKQEIQKFIRFIEGQIELGQSNSKFSLTISNDRISFKDNGAEVAYISNSTLYITDADVTNSLRIGQFAFVPRANGNMSIKLMK